MIRPENLQSIVSRSGVSNSSRLGVKVWEKFEMRNLRELMYPQEGPCVSIYLATEHWRERLPVVLEEVAGRLSRMFAPDVAELAFKPLLGLAQRLALEEKDGNFRALQGVAVFRSTSKVGFVLLRDPVSEEVVVADSFHLLPVIDLIQDSHKYYVMTLRDDRICLYLGTTQGIELTTDSAPGPEHRRGKKGSVDVERFYLTINERLRKSGELGHSPLILLGTPERIALYRSVNSYPHVIEEPVSGHFALDQEEKIRVQIWTRLSHWYAEKEQAAIQEFSRFKHQHRAVDSLEQIAKASVKGRVKTLMVARGVHLWGLVSKDSGRVALPEISSAPRTDDVLDDLAELVVSRGGQVIALEKNQMPTNSPVAAVYYW